MAIEWDARHDRPYSIDGIVIEYDDKSETLTETVYPNNDDGTDDDDKPARRGRKPRA